MVSPRHSHFYYQEIRTTSDERSRERESINTGFELGPKRKGHPAKGGLFFQGRIVPTEIRPSKLSGEIL
jgi:hypothetical protein